MKFSERYLSSTKKNNYFLKFSERYLSSTIRYLIYLIIIPNSLYDNH